MICGKLPPKRDPRTLRLASYVTTRGLPAPPPKRTWEDKVTSLPMHDNDRIGDCTVASQAYIIQTWTAQNGNEVKVSTAAVRANYAAVTGFTPDDPMTDRGAAMLDMLNYWRKNGLDGRRIVAFMKINWRNSTEIKLALNEFGPLYVGAGLPKTTARSGDWTSPAVLSGDAQPYSRGGHAMCLAAYDASWLTFLTWGRRQRASWRWVWDYVDEVYAIVSDDWFTNGRSPMGLDKARLTSDLVKLGAL